jgi:HlyD family secretion protein/adhesin transport system membrane fusion protein
MSAVSSSAKPQNALVIARGGRQRKLLTEPVLFEEQSLPLFVRSGLIAAALFVVLFFVWASVVSVDEVASAPGQVVPSAAVQVVQHLEGGVVGEIRVREGEMVKAGQPLVRMDPAAARSELDQTRARHIGLLLRAERLKAVIEAREPDFAAITSDYTELVADQRRIWAGQLNAQGSAIDVINSQVDQKTREIRQLRDSLDIAQRQLKLTRDQLEIRERGVADGVVSRQVYLETARGQVTAEGEVGRLREQIQVANDSLSEVEKRRRSLGATQAQDALSELGTVSTEVEQVKNTLVKLQDRVDRLEVRAPATGLVQDLKVRTVGEVVAAGATLMRVVPSDGHLEAEVRIQPADVGHVAVGQTVKMKVSSYDYNRYGTLPGILALVSPTTFMDEQNKPYYKGTVSLGRPWVGKVDGQNPVLPGMSLEADIVTGQKVLTEYLFKPIAVSLKSSFHER